MGASYWLRVVMMTLAFVGVVMTIRSLNSGKPIANPLVGILTSNGGGTKAGESVTLCPTRVASVETAGGSKIFEEQMKWYRQTGHSGSKEALDTMAVEKWFGHYCTIPMALNDPSNTTFELAARFTYVNGQTETLSRGTQGANPAVLYQWKGQTFRSPELDAALLNFSALPSAKPPGAG